MMIIITVSQFLSPSVYVAVAVIEAWNSMIEQYGSQEFDLSQQSSSCIVERGWIQIIERLVNGLALFLFRTEVDVPMIAAIVEECSDLQLTDRNKSRKLVWGLRKTSYPKKERTKFLASILTFLCSIVATKTVCSIVHRISWNRWLPQSSSVEQENAAYYSQQFKAMEAGFVSRDEESSLVAAENGVIKLAALVGWEAVGTTQCLNGWYVLVKTLDNAESVKLRYRSLAKATEDPSAKATPSKMISSWL
ncbi:unnamed protein product [Brassica oleracea]|uniref:(rape) hypothetical protein n=1 Tax=Brassica napus TaxID=3708 RepID=A0A816KTM6_BRANA|nr:unnamed protein product [Brassica napus]